VFAVDGSTIHVFNVAKLRPWMIRRNEDRHDGKRLMI